MKATDMLSCGREQYFHILEQSDGRLRFLPAIPLSRVTEEEEQEEQEGEEEVLGQPS